MFSGDEQNWINAIGNKNKSELIIKEITEIDVFGSYQVMADGFYTFERLEYQISLSYSKKTPPPFNAVSY